MNKFATIIVSATVGLVIGMTGLTAANAKQVGLGSANHTQTKCAGAVLHASEIIDGGDKSKTAKKEWIKARNACVKANGGL